MYSCDSFELCYWKYYLHNISMYHKIMTQPCSWYIQSEQTSLEKEVRQENLAKRFRNQPNKSFQEVQCIPLKEIRVCLKMLHFHDKKIQRFARKQETFINIVLLMIALAIQSVVFINIHVPHLYVRGIYVLWNCSASY